MRPCLCLRVRVRVRVCVGVAVGVGVGVGVDVGVRGRSQHQLLHTRCRCRCPHPKECQANQLEQSLLLRSAGKASHCMPRHTAPPRCECDCIHRYMARALHAEWPALLTHIAAPALGEQL
jgi:hypothetical protein